MFENKKFACLLGAAPAHAQLKAYAAKTIKALDPHLAMAEKMENGGKGGDK